jgi:(p)ppGpp synthase/HD superfamily hydrolase
MTRIEQAKQFAHEAHDSINQKRKYSGESYWVHTDAVAKIITELEWDLMDKFAMREDMIIAAHLHDVLEDVYPKNPKFSAQTILKQFGGAVMDMVIDLTDIYTTESYPNLNRAARHKLERERLAIVPVWSKTIKLADLIHNTESIIKEDKDFARVYIPEKIALLPLLANGSPKLFHQAMVQVIESMATLDLAIYE